MFSRFKRNRNKGLLLPREQPKNPFFSRYIPPTPKVTHKSKKFKGNILEVCGPGLYIIGGKTKSGKNVLLQNLIEGFVKRNGDFRKAMVICQKFNQKEFKYLEDCTDKKVTFTTSLIKIEKLKNRFNKYEEEMEKKNIDVDAWKERNKVLVIFNDFFGLCNLAVKNNKIYCMISYLRHVGRWWIVILTQSIVALHPDFYANSNILVSFDSQRRIMKHIEQKTSYDVDIPKMLEWNRKKYHFCMIINDAEKDVDHIPVINMGLNYVHPVKYKNKLEID